MEKETEKDFDEKMLKASFKMYDEFLQLVEDMRTKQKQFFKYKGTDTLKWAKEAEAIVDAKIELYKNPQIFG